MYSPPSLCFSVCLLCALTGKKMMRVAALLLLTMDQGKKLFKKHVQNNTLEKENLIALKKPKQ